MNETKIDNILEKTLLTSMKDLFDKDGMSLLKTVINKTVDAMGVASDALLNLPEEEKKLPADISDAKKIKDVIFPLLEAGILNREELGYLYKVAHSASMRAADSALEALNK